MIEQWVRAGVFSSAERHGAEVLCRPDASGDELIPVAAALALWAPLHGHAAIDLAEVRAIVYAEMGAEMGAEIGTAGHRDPDESAEGTDARLARLHWPTTAQWLDALHRSPVCRTVSDADLSPDPTSPDPTSPDLARPAEPVLDDRPLVLRGTLLATQRQWVDECIVAGDLRQRASVAPIPVDASTAHLLDQLLPRPSRQHEAGLRALSSRLTVIVGGPGTGKTHTIARLLLALQHQAKNDHPALRVALAAPTGKAAARMAEALVDASPNGSLADLRPTTIHRLLGGRGQRTRFLHGPDHPLEADVVVIDEASMVALPLMARLVEALRAETRLILVGDPDQLESIEVGAVLADIVRSAAVTGSPLASSVIRLDRAHRQAAGSLIGPLADAVRSGAADAVMAQLRASCAEITFVDTAPFGLAGAEQAIRDLVLPSLRLAHAAAESGDADEAFAAFARTRVLCAHRTGAFGVQRWNRTIESWLRGGTVGGAVGGTAGGSVGGAAGGAVGGATGRQQPGRPLLATRNDPRLGIANGDTGIIVATSSGPRAAFATGNGIRLLAPAQLDSVETAYAVTVHKSQGSEYHTVIVILPPATSPLIGRELLYTAITRASDHVVVVGDESAVRACVNNPGQRVTGLATSLARPWR